MSRSAMIGKVTSTPKLALIERTQAMWGVVAVDRQAQKLGVHRGELIGAAGRRP
jgi:hypothetical protein